MIPRACGVALTFGSLLFGAAPVASAGGPERVVHHGTWSDDGVLWKTRWTAGSGRALDEVELATELPEGTRILHTPETRAVSEEGRLVRLEPYRPMSSGSLEVWVPQDRDAGVLVVPLLDGAGVQRVTVDGMDFEPSDPALEKHVRYWAPPGIAGDGRKDFERRARRSGWDRARPGDQAVYIRAEQRYVRAGGLPGRLKPEGAISWMVQLFLGTVLVGLLGFGALLYRGLDRQARAERNRAYIDRHFGEGSAEPEVG